MNRILSEVVERYLELFPDEAASLAQLRKQLSDKEKLNDRRNFHGHITGSGIVLSPDKSKILLIHHKAFNQWQQPGGHWEDDDEANPLDTARRETEEETGIKIAEYLSIDSNYPLTPLDLNSHQTLARPQKNEPAHRHHDFRYVFVAESTELNLHDAGVDDAGWYGFEAPETEKVRGIIAKLRRFGFIAD